MKNLKALSDGALLETTKSLVAEERKLTTEILWHLREIQTRRLYATEGYSSLFDYATRGLGYSEAAAGRRIAAMKLLVEVPEIEASLQEGKISLSTLCTLQNFFQRKETPTSKEEKKELAFALQGKSRRECEKALVALAPEAAPPAERERVISPTETEIRFVADEALMQKLKRIRELDAHMNPDPSYLELFHRLADLALKKLDPEAKTPRKTTPPAESKPVSNGREHIDVALKYAVWKKSGSRCSYVSPNGTHCTSRFGLEIDHIVPVAQGGPATLSNLRLLCRTHNSQEAIAHLGVDTMRPYLRLDEASSSIDIMRHKV